MSEDEIGSSFVEEELCKFCLKYLSVPPILGSAGSYVCGRCNVNLCDPDNAHTYVQQYLYEQLASTRTFSCPYKRYGCKTVIQWGEGDEHQDLCIYRLMHCPLSHEDMFPDVRTKCQWIGRGSQIAQHVKVWHSDYIKCPLAISISGKNSIHFTYVNKVLFAFVVLATGTNKFKLAAFTVGTPKSTSMYRYQMEIFNDKRDNSVIAKRNHTLPIHTLKEELQTQDNMLVVDLNKFEHFLSFPNHPIGKVGIVKKNKKELENLADDLEELMIGWAKNDTSRPLYKQILQTVECPVCHDYMVPPIYLCTAGHSICNSCILRLQFCPCCKGELSNARNFTLEKVTTCFNFPCSNQSIGCFHVATGDVIRYHELSCMYSAKRCVLRCDWKGSSEDMKAHIRESHLDEILELNNEYTPVDITKEIAQRSAVIFYEGEIFLQLISNHVEQKVFKIRLQHLNMQDEAEYGYEVDFLDERKLGLKYHVSCLCSKVIPPDSDDALVILTDSLKPFIANNIFHFKISIHTRIL